MAKDLERRVERLENFLDSSHEPVDLGEMISRFEEGGYGGISPMSIVASILSNGGSVDHLCGNLPDKLIDFFAERCGEVVPNADKAKTVFPIKGNPTDYDQT